MIGFARSAAHAQTWSQGSRARLVAVLGAIAFVGLLLMAQGANAAGFAWSAGAPVPYPAAVRGSSAAALGDGRVLVVGGVDDNNNIVATAWIYDPSTQSWSSAAPIPGGNFAGVAAPLPDGNVLVTSGIDSAFNETDATRIYDPTSDTWSSAAPIPIPNQNQEAATVSGGKVLVTGGYGSTATAIYDPTANTWSSAAPVPEAHFGGVAAPLPGGKALVTGGSDTNYNFTGVTEIYDPGTDSWSAGQPLPYPDYLAAASPLTDGRVLVTGGYDSGWGGSTHTQIYDPSSDTWAQGPSGAAHVEGVAAPLPNDGALVTGGKDASGYGTNATEILGPLPPSATSTGVVCSPAKVMVGTATTCTATVTDTSATPANPSGTVSFSSTTSKASFSGSPCTLAPVASSNSASTCQVTYTPIGSTSTVTASYGADPGHTTSSGQTVVKIVYRTTKTTLRCDQATLSIGQSTSCTATVTDTAPGQTSTPTGAVVFSGNSGDRFTPGTCSLSGSGTTASCLVQYKPTTGPNTHSITARYKGGGNDAGSSGTTKIQVTP